ncbi:MAG: oxidoreductase, partial [Candidatus Nitrosothermus koennekii]
VKEFISIVYAKPEYVDTLDKSTPISEHVNVDFELYGCPVNKYQLLEVLTSFLHNKRPNIHSYSVCLECKRAGNVCVMVAKGEMCMGPVTNAGCNALCPSYNRGCYSCFGPKEEPNTSSLKNVFKKLGMDEDSIIRLFRNFNAYAKPFKEVDYDKE